MNVVRAVRAPEGVAAVVLTHRRPTLATETVTGLLVEEGLEPAAVVLVIDRDGGLSDTALEASIRTVRLTDNAGPAAGFRAGIEEALTDSAVQWLYLCEDDACLLGAAMPRVGRLLDAVAADGRRIGAVVVAGRRYGGHGDRTHIVVADPAGPVLQPVDVAAWGMTLLSRAVVEAGVRPDDHWFFGYEDFDFFLRVRAAGFLVLMDRDGAIAVAAQSPSTADSRRPAMLAESWRSYYLARNAFEIIRRHGSPSWYGWHLVNSAKRLRHIGAPGRRALVRGLIDGMRGIGGRNPLYVRTVGEHPPTTTRRAPDA